MGASGDGAERFVFQARKGQMPHDYKRYSRTKIATFVLIVKHSYPSQAYPAPAVSKRERQLFLLNVLAAPVNG
jgi:hypothetical protein